MNSLEYNRIFEIVKSKFPEFLDYSIGNQDYLFFQNNEHLGYCAITKFEEYFPEEIFVVFFDSIRPTEEMYVDFELNFHQRFKVSNLKELELLFSFLHIEKGPAW